MATNAKDKMIFRFETLPRATKKALDFLSSQKWLGNSNWYLAGGTALALSTGLRKSVDLDFFTPVPKFTTESVMVNFNKDVNWETTFEEPNTLYGSLYKAKVSFIAYPFFVPKQKMLNYGNVKILQALDIAVMKIIAISQRGRKRDFFDLYWCAKNIEPLESLIKRLKVQYPSVAHDYHHILKSLTYFDDAESDPAPVLNLDVSWSEVKKYFQKEVPQIVKKLIKLRLS